jgi:spore cortex biosynthesis protein YabQ
MEITVSEQLSLLICAVLIGIALGAVYDIFRMLRVITHCGRAAVFVLDILYWLVCTAVSFVFLLLQNDGKLRTLAIISEVGGAAIYYYTIGALVIKRAEAVSNSVKRKTKKAVIAAARPIKRFGRTAGAKIAKNCRAAGNIAKKDSNLLQISLKVHCKMLYNLIQSMKQAKKQGKRKRRKVRGFRHEKTPEKFHP